VVYFPKIDDEYVGVAHRTIEIDNGEILKKEKSFTAIPYYAWAHRDRCEMTVWPAYDKNYAQKMFKVR
jgi:DUF1680 family protein